jgi:predicted RNA methylase
MFNKDFFPTPLEVIEQMMEGETIEGKVILEPSAGKGDMVDYLINAGAKNVIACENSEDLKKILQTKCNIIESDFLNLTSDKISHIDIIVMNPPFTADERHILHAYEIAPAGCKIIALCNTATLENAYSKSRKQLVTLIESYGFSQSLGDCFSEAQRKTGVNVSLIKIQKAGSDYNTEFEGFFMDEDEPENTAQAAGIMQYNVVRDLVNRYVAAVKLYDQQLNTGKQMDDLLGNFYGEGLTFTCSEKGAPLLRAEFKKGLQKAGWKFILNKMNLTKFATRGLREDINQFVEKQTEVPFTMKNIYFMLDMVIQTAGQRMDKALLEVFDRVTSHHHDNRHNIKGWKTNAHYLVCKKFILPYMINPAKEYGYTSNCYTSLKSSFDGTIPDFEKALCYIKGINYDEINTVNATINRASYGEWYNSEFFKYKGYKNGNMHFEFVDEKLWENFNQRVAKLKGYPLFEGKEQTAYQKRQTGRTNQKGQPAYQKTKEPVILSTIKIKTA